MNKYDKCQFNMLAQILLDINITFCFMYLLFFVLLIVFLGYLVVHVVFLIVLMCFLYGCQTTAKTNNVTPVKSDVQQEQSSVNKINQLSYSENRIEDLINASDNLRNFLSNRITNTSLTNNTYQIPTDWMAIDNRFQYLSKQHQHNINSFYKDNNYKMIWINNDGKLTNNAQKILDILNQEVYLTTPISNQYLPTPIINQQVTYDDLVKIDLEFTMNLLPAIEAVRNGLTTTQKGGITENNGYKPFDFYYILKEFQQDTPKDVLDDLTNFHEQYALLKQQIIRLNEISKNGGYIEIPMGETLRPNMIDPIIIPLIRKRLVQGGFDVSDLDNPLYDDTLKQQVMAFQASRGIKPDGIIGNKAYSALRHSVLEDIKIILANFERIRRSPIVTSKAKQVRVNIPQMNLRVTKGDQTLLAMKTIVGRKDRQTPIFNDQIEYIDFNPYWNVPYSLATKDILPKLKRNPNYGISKGIKIYQGGKAIDQTTIAWSKYSKNNFPFNIRQNPGPRNALGTVKFIFPNKHAVYLHDTPAKSRFATHARLFSSGCIRVSRPKELAEMLLENKVSSNRISQIFASRNNKAIYLDEPVPVILEYMTAFVKDNILNIRPDIYDYDERLIQELIKVGKEVKTYH